LACCPSFSAQALPPASNRMSALRPPSAKARCHRRTVSSSRNSASATCSQLMPPSSKTSALARRANRFVTEPSRATAISAQRYSGDKNPPRIMPPTESISRQSASAFRILNESGYRSNRHPRVLSESLVSGRKSAFRAGRPTCCWGNSAYLQGPLAMRDCKYTCVRRGKRHSVVYNTFS
jgi:hypothetical protein